MTYDSIISDIKSKVLKPVYALHGEESYYIDKLTSFFEKHVMPEAEQSFNQIVLYGKDIDFKTVVDNARQFPMMAERRLVVIREAQDLKDFDKLESYFAQPSPQTVLVFAYKHKKPDKRKKVWKTLSKNAEMFESKKIYDNQLPPFIRSYLKNHKISIEEKATALLVEFLGTDLSKVANELDKLVLNVKEGGTVKAADIHANIGISKDFNIFELNKCLGNRDAIRSYKIVQYFANNEKDHPPQATIPALTSYFYKLMVTKANSNLDDRSLVQKIGGSTFFMKDYKSAARNFNFQQLKNVFKVLHQADLRSKGVGSRGKNTMGVYQDIVHGILTA